MDDLSNSVIFPRGGKLPGDDILCEELKVSTITLKKRWKCWRTAVM